MTTLRKIMEEAARASAIQRQYEVPLAVQQAMAWQREHDEAVRWKREYDLAQLAQDEMRRSEAAQRTMRFSLDAEMQRAAQQAAELRQMVALAQPPAWLLPNSIGMAALSHESLASRELRDWLTSQEEMRKQFAVIEELSRSTSLMHEQLTRWARDEAERTRLMSAFNEPSFAKLLYRERALYRTAHSLVDQWAESPELLSSYPEICRGAPFVSPNSAVRATIRIVEPTTGDEGEAQEDDARAINVLAITRQERDRRLATLHEAVPESMAGAREALTAKGPDFAAKCAVCLRRALETTLDVVAPSKAVSVWQDPKLKMRGDGNGPTRASRLHFAFRNLPKNHRAARFVEADVMMTEALMETINPTIHRPGGERDVEQLDIYVQRMEIVLLVLASLPRE